MNAVFGSRGLFNHDSESVGALCLVPLLPAQLPAGASLTRSEAEEEDVAHCTNKSPHVPSCACTCHGLHLLPTTPQFLSPKTMFSDALCLSVLAGAKQSLSQKRAL